MVALAMALRSIAMNRQRYALNPDVYSVACTRLCFKLTMFSEQFTQEVLGALVMGPGQPACLKRRILVSIDVMQVADLDDVKVKSVCCGWRHSCALDNRGTLYTWGWGEKGQLGHGNNQ
jgi:alpha-tubulin suppressor-like RCC1 family protein